MDLVRITNAARMIVTRRLQRNVSLYTKHGHLGGAGGRTFYLVYFHH